MERRNLGKSGLTVPIIGMGTWKTFDVRGPAEEALRAKIVETAYEHGADFYDSSPMYREAERVLGGAVERLGLRDKVMIATKVWTESDEKSLVQFENSLRFFGGYVDLYQVHNLAAWPTRLNQLEKLKAEGKVEAVGITHYQQGAFGEMEEIMRSGRVAAIQIPYNALDRAAEKSILPLAQKLEIGVLVMRPFGEGGLLRQTPPAEELAPFAEFGVKSWPQILLKWIASDPRVSVIIPATSKPERMAENAAAGEPPFFDGATRERVSRLAQKYNLK